MNPRINTCPCCSSLILRHARQGGVYWFCPTCRQEVPSLANNQLPYANSFSSTLIAQIGQRAVAKQVVGL